MKKHIKVLIVLLIFIPVSIFIYYYTVMYCLPHDHYHPHSCNPEAKNIFVGTASILEDIKLSSGSLPDGIYIGRFDGVEAGYEYPMRGEALAHTITPEEFDDMLNWFCFMDWQKNFGYYCVGIKDGQPVAAYQSRDPIAYDRAEDLIGSYENGTPFMGMYRVTKLSGTYLLGAYPYACGDDTVEIPTYGTSLPVYRTCPEPAPSARRPFHMWYLLIYDYIGLCLIYSIYKALSMGIAKLVSMLKRKDR